MKRLLLILFCLLFTVNCRAADINWAADAGSSKSGSTTGEVPAGTISNMFDEVTSTKYGSNHFGDVLSDTTIGKSDFASSHKITKIKIIVSRGEEWLAGGGTGSYAIEAYYNGGWNTIQTGSLPVMGLGGTPTTVDVTGLNLSGVSKVKVTVVDIGDETGYGWSSDAWVYELYAYGPKSVGGYTIIY